MRIVTLNRRQARMLRTNLTSNQEGYDYTDLRRLDRIAGELTEAQGDYAAAIAVVARAERLLRRRLVRATEPAEIEQCNRELQDLAYQVEDLDEAAELVSVELPLSDSDHQLVADKLASVERWMSADGVRHVVIGMVEAVRSAAHVPDADGAGLEVEREKPRRLRRA